MSFLAKVCFKLLENLVINKKYLQLKLKKFIFKIKSILNYILKLK